MTHILKFTSGPDDWRALLAEPTRHWRTGYSARTLAHCWEATAGFPPEVSVAFAAPPDPRLADLVPLLAVPEFRVPLPGGERSSQNDIFVLAHSKAGPVSIMVEGKVNETFGPTLDEWQADSTPGKKRRLALLLETLALPGTIDSAIRYQLLHRAASAVLEGERYRAKAAVLLVDSFSSKRTGWSDYRKFLELFGVEAQVACPQLLGGK